MRANTARKIFVNLPVRDLNSFDVTPSRHLGFTFDHRFTDDNARAWSLSDAAFVMLLIRVVLQDVHRPPAVRHEPGTPRALRAFMQKQGGSGRDGENGHRRWRKARHGPAGPRFHVWLEFLRPRRASLGGHLDGFEDRPVERRPLDVIVGSGHGRSIIGSAQVGTGGLRLRSDGALMNSPRPSLCREADRPQLFIARRGVVAHAASPWRAAGPSRPLPGSLRPVS